MDEGKCNVIVIFLVVVRTDDLNCGSDELMIIAWNECNILTAKYNSPALLDAVDRVT